MKQIEIEQRRTALQNGNGFCPICKKPLITMQGAHRIGNREIYRKKYGSWVIDSPANMVIVDNLKCNASCDVGSSYGNHLEVIADILIYEYMQMWGAEGLGKLADKITAEYKKLGANNDRK
jgi:hypothetical protein